MRAKCIVFPGSRLLVYADKTKSQAPATEAATPTRRVLTEEFTFLSEKLCPPPMIHSDDSVIINCTGEEGGEYPALVFFFKDSGHGQLYT